MALTSSPWSPAVVTRLVELWKEGLSARDVAERLSGFGPFVNRNMVIGKLDRLRAAGIEVDGPKSRRKLRTNR